MPATADACTGSVSIPSRSPPSAHSPSVSAFTLHGAAHGFAESPGARVTLGNGFRVVGFFAFQLAIAGQALRVEPPRGNGFLHRTARLAGVRAIDKPALLAQRLDVLEHGFQARLGLGNAQLAHAWTVEQQ